MKAATVLLISGESEQGQPIWCFLVVSTEHLESVMVAQQAGTFNPQDFGAVVASGEGEEPSVEVKQRMAEQYGYDAEKMVDIDIPQAAEISRQAKTADSCDPRYFVQAWNLDDTRILAVYRQPFTD